MLYNLLYVLCVYKGFTLWPGHQLNTEYIFNLIKDLNKERIVDRGKENIQHGDDTPFRLNFEFNIISKLQLTEFNTEAWNNFAYFYIFITNNKTFIYFTACKQFYAIQGRILKAIKSVFLQTFGVKKCSLACSGFI